MNTKLDFTKPVRTRDGRPARIICTDRKSDAFQIVALVTEEGREVCQTFTLDGQLVHTGESGWDLVNVPVKHKRTGWLNIYNDPARRIKLHASRESADDVAASDRLACKEITFEFEEGEGL